MNIPYLMIDTHLAPIPKSITMDCDREMCLGTNCVPVNRGQRSSREYVEGTYCVIDTLKSAGDTYYISRTIYGDPPRWIRDENSPLVTERFLNSVIRENRKRIEEAREEYKRSDADFIWALYQMIVCCRGQIVGAVSMSSYISHLQGGDWGAKETVYEKAVLPTGRVSIPFRVEVLINHLIPWIDMGHYPL